MRNGIGKESYDLRDLDFCKSLGSVSPAKLPDEFNADTTGEFPDQNKDNYPMGCTGYTQNDLGQNAFKRKFDPAYVYNNTLTLANLPPHSPCQVRDSLKAVRLWGLQPREGGNALDFKRGSYFSVNKVDGSYFEGVRNALWLNREAGYTVSVGSPWFWGTLLPKDGKFSKPKKYVWDKNTPGHNWEIVGWKGDYLIVKAWAGPTWGDKGYGYMSKEIFEKLMAISGTSLYTQANWRKEDSQSINLDLQEFIMDILRRLKILR